jgi:hypothetical protein
VSHCLIVSAMIDASSKVYPSSNSETRAPVGVFANFLVGDRADDLVTIRTLGLRLGHECESEEQRKSEEPLRG